MKDAGKAVRPAKTKWREVVLVCGKCSGSSAVRKGLKKAAKKLGDGKALRIVETSCMGLCPKRAVTVGRGRDLGGERPRLHVVRDGAKMKHLRALLES